MTTREALPEPRLDVLVRGSGPALLLAHGAGGGIHGNFGLVLDDLARDHTLIGPHYPGAGNTPADEKPLELDELADQLVASAVSAGEESFVLVGESLGCAVAVRAAARHPGRVRALVLTAGFPVADPVLALAARLIKSLAADGRWEEVARLACLSCMTAKDLAEIEPAALDTLVSQTLAAMPAGTVDHFDLVSRVDVRADLAGLSVPVLVVVPTGDRLVLPDGSRRLAAGIAGAELVELPGAAHVLSGPDRATWLRHVRAFLGTVGPGTR
ncbi:alpha/beta fold hydrolase [Streptomyces sp. NBC_00102]|uniref:alpha/beta fold hydrolase n=1 Tax=Streptomyces sp. NBC_00102 TaxID=2975652 RepID=UPI00224E61B9|nr:alpha/beta hydrolase [Streptomyces sp. NBC_00102]MCX5399250.1 alpha/beta hydrolase [Streptomyces sp. NBC_00102]